MTPVLRVVLPTANLTESPREDGGQAHNIVRTGTNADYITEDPGRNKPIPASAIYAARMDANGIVTVVRSRQPGFEPDHTYLGWPIPD
jgi:hypothetical protein